MGTAKVRIGGPWSGVLEVELGDGRVLRDGDSTQKLSQLGVKNNANILASKVSTTDQQGKSVKDEFLAEEKRSKKLSRIMLVPNSV